ncbi:hypothetical protein ACYZUD_02080 [Pseudomonas sp. XS1P51]
MDEHTVTSSNRESGRSFENLPDSSGAIAARERDNLSAIVAALFVGCASLIGLGVIPILLGELAQMGRLSVAGIGNAASAEITTLAFGACVGPFLINRGYVRMVGVGACLLLAVSTIALRWAPTPEFIYVMRGVAGLCEGFAMAAAVLVTTHSAQPDRLNAVFLAVTAIPQLLAAYLLPLVLLPRWGIDGGLVYIAAVGLIAAVGGLFLPRSVQLKGQEEGGTQRLTGGALIFSVAILLVCAAEGTAWTYVERMGSILQHSAEVISFTIGASLALQIIASFGVAIIGWRLSFRFALTAGALILAISAIGITWQGGLNIYVISTCVFMTLWVALQPFQVRLAIQIDPGRRLALLITPLSLFGLGIGPFLLSPVIAIIGVTGAFHGAAVLIMISLVLFSMVYGASGPAHVQGNRAGNLHEG